MSNDIIYSYCPAPVYVDGSDASTSDIRWHLEQRDRDFALTKAFIEEVDEYDLYDDLKDMGFYLSDDQISDMHLFIDTGEFDSRVFSIISDQLITVLSTLEESSTGDIIHPTSKHPLMIFCGDEIEPHPMSSLASFVGSTELFHRPIERKK